MATLVNGSDNFSTKKSSHSRVLQITNKLIPLESSTAIPAGRKDTLIGPDYFIDIVAKGNNSKFKIYFRWIGEQSMHHDTMFNIHRSGTRINCGINDTDYGLVGVSSSHLYTDNNSTLETANVVTLDKSGSFVGQRINYQMVVNSLSAQTFWNNRCYNASIQGNFEKGCSEIIVMEYT